MRCIFPVFAAAFTLVLPSLAAAAAPAPAATPSSPDAHPKASAGIDGLVALPIGNAAEAAGFGFGGLLRLDYRVADHVSVGARAGFIYHLSKDVGLGSAGFSEVPIFASVRFHFAGPGEDGPYAAFELGPTLIFGRATVNGITASSSDTKLGATFGGGYQLGALDLRAGFLVLDAGHLGDTLAVVAGAGYTFAAF